MSRLMPDPADGAARRCWGLPTVGICLNQLLPYSQTFVLDQARALRRHAPVFVGCRREPGLDIAEETSLVVNANGLGGRLAADGVKAFGRIPRSLAPRTTIRARLLH